MFYKLLDSRTRDTEFDSIRFLSVEFFVLLITLFLLLYFPFMHGILCNKENHSLCQDEKQVMSAHLDQKVCVHAKKTLK